MLTNNYKLYIVLPLLATVSKGDWKDDCKKSFEDMTDFNPTSAVVSAPGFVESFTIPAGWEKREQGMILEPYEYANGTVTSYKNGPDKTRLYPEFKKKIVVEVNGTGGVVNWPGYNVMVDDSVNVNWTTFMEYFAAGGAGVVIDLENYSTLTAVGSVTGKTYGVARPEKLYKIAIAVHHTTNLTITISHANVLTLSTSGVTSQTLWMATDNGDIGTFITRPSFGEKLAEFEGQVTLNRGPNTCFKYDAYFIPAPTPTQPPSPTPQPTASGAAAARSSGLLGAFSLLAAACLALRS